jgi:hypothetical protein
MQQTAKSQGFFVGQWGVWGWVETILRVIGLVAGLGALSGPFAGGGIVIGGNPELGAVIVVALLTLIGLPLVLVRVGQRELISIAFAILNFLGHAALLIALLQIPVTLVPALVFGIFHILGLFAKFVFLRASGYTESGQTTPKMIQFNFVFMAVYVIYVVALLI